MIQFRSRALLLPSDQQLRHVLILWISAFFFHTVADPTVTYVAVNLLEVGTETNPFIQSQLDRGFLRVVLMHIPLYILGIAGFVVLQWLLNRGSEQEQRHVYYLSLTLLSVINIWGIWLVWNNLRVIWIMS